MAAAKARGVKFGNPLLTKMNKTRKRQAKQFADTHSKLILHLRSEQKTLRQICEILNNSGITTRNGSQFNPIQFKPTPNLNQFNPIQAGPKPKSIQYKKQFNSNFKFNI